MQLTEQQTTAIYSYIPRDRVELIYNDGELSGIRIAPLGGINNTDIDNLIEYLSAYGCLCNTAYVDDILFILL